jgi:hypothetical protein
MSRTLRMVACVAAAAGATAACLLAAGPGPAGPALVTGVLTWLALALRRQLRFPASGARARQATQPGSEPVATGLAGSSDQADQDPT